MERAGAAFPSLDEQRGEWETIIGSRAGDESG